LSLTATAQEQVARPPAQGTQQTAAKNQETPVGLAGVRSEAQRRPAGRTQPDASLRPSLNSAVVLQHLGRGGGATDPQCSPLAASVHPAPEQKSADDAAGRPHWGNEQGAGQRAGTPRHVAGVGIVQVTAEQHASEHADY